MTLTTLAYPGLHLIRLTEWWHWLPLISLDHTCFGL